jgi:hypothetical protein
MEPQVSGFEFFRILKASDWKNFAIASQKSHRTTVKTYEMSEWEIFLRYQLALARELGALVLDDTCVSRTFAPASLRFAVRTPVAFGHFPEQSRPPVFLWMKFFGQATVCRFYFISSCTRRNAENHKITFGHDIPPLRELN